MTPTQESTSVGGTTAAQKSAGPSEPPREPPSQLPPKETDAELVRRAAAGSELAFRSLYRAYVRPVYWLAHGILRDPRDAEDVRVALGSGGRLTVPCLGLYGDASLSHRSAVEEVGNELAEDVTVQAIPGSGHWIAEENPRALVATVLRFDGDRPPGVRRPTSGTP